MEAKVRRSEMLREKMFFTPEMLKPVRPPAAPRLDERALTQTTESDLKSEYQCFKLNTTQLSKHPQPKTGDNDKLWTARDKFNCMEYRIKRVRPKSKKPQRELNWTMILAKSENVISKNIRQRIDNFEKSNYLIARTMEKLRLEEDQLIKTGLRDIGVRI